MSDVDGNAAASGCRAGHRICYGIFIFQNTDAFKAGVQNGIIKHGFGEHFGLSLD